MNIGDRVRHARFGLGTVKDLPEEDQVTVLFDKAGLRRFVISRAGLVVVSPEEERSLKSVVFEPGMRVEHFKFGKGTVSSVEEAGPLVIAFDRSDEKRVDPNFGVLSVLSPEREREEAEAELAVYQNTFAAPDPPDAHYPGSHWALLENGVKGILNDLPKIISESNVCTGWEGPAHPKAYKHPSEPQGFALRWSESELAVTIVLTPTSESNQIVSVFPCSSHGTIHKGQLQKVYPWESRLEGQLEVQIKDALLTFHDARYVPNRWFYKAGKDYEFFLAGLAYSFRKAQCDPMIISNPESVAIYNKVGIAEGDTVELSTEGLACLLPITDYDRDEYSFRGPVQSVSRTSFYGEDVFRMRVTVMRSLEDDSPLDLDVYVSERQLDDGYIPREGDDVEGILWLQGYMVQPC